ncbi:hypothetical protein [Paraflavitalea speifideaquila]|nr:hypothetical protein [Paraflavitalea speifideiaquila]
MSLFNFINQIYERTSFIITTNKNGLSGRKCSEMKYWQRHDWTAYCSNVK